MRIPVLLLLLVLLSSLPVRAESAKKPSALMVLLSQRRASAADVEALLDAGANLHERDANGMTPLHWFLSSHNFQGDDILELLLDRGADPMALDNVGRAPFDLARRLSRDYAKAIAERIRARLLLFEESRVRVERLSESESRLTFRGGSTYVGPMEDGKPHGTGTCTVNGVTSPCTYFEGGRVIQGTLLEDGRRYDGELVVHDGFELPYWKLHGSGVMRHLNGDTFEGVWSRGSPTANGTYTWAHSRATYRGDHYSEGRPNGEGTCTLEGVATPCVTRDGWWMRPGDEVVQVKFGVYGGRYYGPVKNGKPEGFGRWAGRQGEEEYWGNWSDGLPHGDGLHRLADWGYRGSWHAGKKHGRGTCIAEGLPEPCSYENGERYEYVGQLRKGVPHGKGDKVFRSSPSLFGGGFSRGYSGYWKNGVYHGQGTLTGNGVRYVGEFRSGKKHGRGRAFVEPSAKERYFVHEGLYRDDKPNGKGRITWVGGEQYEGPFVDGEPHGEGRCSKSGSSSLQLFLERGQVPPPMGKDEAEPCAFEHGKRVK